MSEYLTRASNARADFLCEGRHLAQKGLKDEFRSEDAEMGTRGHHAVATGDMTGLSDDEVVTVSRAIKREKEILEEWAKGEAYQTHQEITLHIKNEEGQIIHRGTPDFFAITEETKRGIIIDRKMLFGDIPEPAINLQFRDYVALVWSNFEVIDCEVHKNQPWKPKTVPAYYDARDMNHAYVDMMARVNRSNHPFAKRTAGEEQCKFCLAKATCKEHQDWLTQTQSNLTTIDSKVMERIVPQYKQVEYYLKAKEAKRVIDNWVKNFEKTVKENIEKWPDFILEEVDGDREIVDAELAHGKTADIVPQSVLMGLIKIPIGKFEDAFVKRIKMNAEIRGEKMTVEEAKKEFNSRLAAAIQRKKEKRLKYVKRLEEK